MNQLSRVRHGVKQLRSQKKAAGQIPAAFYCLADSNWSIATNFTKDGTASSYSLRRGPRHSFQEINSQCSSGFNPNSSWRRFSYFCKSQSNQARGCMDRFGIANLAARDSLATARTNRHAFPWL